MTQLSPTLPEGATLDAGDAIPPLPDGATLDSALPPLPNGATLDVGGEPTAEELWSAWNVPQDKQFDVSDIGDHARASFEYAANTAFDIGLAEKAQSGILLSNREQRQLASDIAKNERPITILQFPDNHERAGQYVAWMRADTPEGPKFKEIYSPTARGIADQMVAAGKSNPTTHAISAQEYYRLQKAEQRKNAPQEPNYASLNAAERVGVQAYNATASFIINTIDEYSRARATLTDPMTGLPRQQSDIPFDKNKAVSEFTIPVRPAGNLTEKLADITGSLAPAVAEAIMLKRVYSIPGVTAGQNSTWVGRMISDMSKWETLNVLNGGQVGFGTAQGGVETLAGAIPVSGWKSYALKILAESAGYQFIAKLQGGDTTDQVVQALLPVALRAYRPVRQYYAEKILHSSPEELRATIEEMKQLSSDPVAAEKVKQGVAVIEQGKADIIAEQNNPSPIAQPAVDAKSATEVAKPENSSPTLPQDQQTQAGSTRGTPEIKPTDADWVQGITNATIERERAALGLPPATHGDTLAGADLAARAAAKARSDPQAINRLLDDLRTTGRARTPQETFEVLHKRVELENERVKIAQERQDAVRSGDTAKYESLQASENRVINEIADITDILTKTATPAGQALVFQRALMKQDFSYAGMTREREVARGKRLSDEELANVKAQSEKIAQLEREKSAADAEVAAAQKRIAELDRELAIKETMRQLQEQTRRPRGTRTAAYGGANRLITTEKYNAIKSDLLSMTTLNDAVMRLPDLLLKVSELGLYHIEAGTRSFAEWSRKVLADISPELRKIVESHLEGISKEQNAKYWQAERELAVDKVRANPEGNLNRPANKIAESLMGEGMTDHKQIVAAVRAELEKVLPGISEAEAVDAIIGSGKHRQQTKTEMQIEMANLRKELRKQRGVAAKTPKGTDADRAAQSYITRTENRIKELQNALDTGDFSTKTKARPWQERDVTPDLKKKALDIEHRLELIKSQHNEAVVADRMRNRSFSQKVLGRVGESINLSRALITSFDLSAVLRQGGFIVMGNPIRAIRAMKDMFKAISKKGEFAVNKEIKERENYALYKKSGLELTEQGTSLAKMEEAFMSRWAEKVPGVAASQRAYTAFLNRLRADTFDSMAASLGKSGVVTAKEAEAIANYINVATGRGKLGKHDSALAGLNTVMFAPRLVASRFQLLGLQPLYRGTMRTRKLVAMEYAKYLIGMGTVYGLAELMGADLTFDPRHPDFGKIVVGNTRIDPLSGLAQTARITAVLATGEKMSPYGAVKDVRGENVPYGSGDAADVVATFARSKLAPAPGTALNLLAGKDVVGNQFTYVDAITNLTIPMNFGDIYNAMQEQGVPAGAAMGLLSIFGAGLNTYAPR